MSSWSYALTNKGRQLQAKAQAGAQLVYTRMAVGSGTLSGQSLESMTALIAPVKDLTITRLKRPAGSTRALIGATLTNQDVTTGFYLREVGIFADDPDDGEILYMYANAGATADYITPQGDGVIEKAINMNVFVGSAANITANIDESLVYATQQDLADAIAGIQINDATTTQKGIVQLSNATNSTAEDKAATPKAVKLAYDAAVAAQTTANAANTAAANAGTKADTAIAQLADVTAQGVRYAADTGTANGKVVTLPAPVPTAYFEGMAIAFKNKTQNTGAVTINVNGLGEKSILKSNGLTLASGNLKADSIYTIRYNGTAFILQGEGGEYGTATTSDVRSGKTIPTESGMVSGSLATRDSGGAVTVTPGASGQTLQAGIYDHDITVNPGASYKDGVGNFVLVSGTTYRMTVDELPFTPSIVICKDSNGNFVAVYINKNNINTNARFIETDQNSTTGYGAIAIIANGFTFTLANRSTTTPVYWIAVA